MAVRSQGVFFAARGAMAAVEDDMEQQDDTETMFVQEDVLAIIKDSVDGVLSTATYSQTKVKQGPPW